MSGAARFAVYFAPRPGTALARFGAGWLGRDVETGAEVPAIEVAGLPGPREALAAAARRYGFHATLKAPFRLGEGATVEGLMRAVASLAAEREPVALAGLRLEALGAWLALTCGGASEAIDRLAADCVTRLDGFRAPPSAAELARRRAGGLLARQEAHLRDWGYPYVLDEFRFHMTLAGPLDPGASEAVAAALAPALGEALAAPAAIEDLCLCVEPAPGAGFRVLRRLPLGR